MKCDQVMTDLWFCVVVSKSYIFRSTESERVFTKVEETNGMRMYFLAVAFIHVSAFRITKSLFCSANKRQIALNVISELSTGDVCMAPLPMQITSK